MTLPGVLPKRILVLEDEAVLRSNMIRGLAKLPGLGVAGAGTVAEALAEVDRMAPDLVISDIDLPDRLGLEMIGELRQRGVPAPIVFVSAYVKAYQAQIASHSGVEVLEKPVSIEQLRKVVQEKLAGQRPSQNPFGVPDYLQLAGLGRHSVVVDIQGPVGQGRIVVLDGEPWSAADASGTGLDAFRRLAMARDCTISCVTLRGEPGPRSLEGSMDALLLDAACSSDESSLAAAGEPEGDSEFDELMDQGIALALAKRYPQALETFQCAKLLRPEDRRVEANILRLIQILKPE